MSSLQSLNLSISQSLSLGWASELVQAEEPAQHVAQALLGHVLLVQDVAAAYVIARELPIGCLAVTLDGVLVHAGGIVETVARDPQQSILAREEAWRSAVAELETARVEFKRLKTIASQHEGTIQSQQEEADKFSGESRYVERKIQRARQELTNHQRTLDRARQQQTYLVKQTEAYTQELVTRPAYPVK